VKPNVKLGSRESHTGGEVREGRTLTHSENGNPLQYARYVIPSTVLVMSAGSHLSGMAKGISASFMDLMCSSQGIYFKRFLGRLPLTARESRQEEKDRGGSRLHHLTYNLLGNIRDTPCILPGPLRPSSHRSMFWGLFWGLIQKSGYALQDLSY